MKNKIKRAYYGCNDFCSDVELDAKSRRRLMEFVSDAKTREQILQTPAYTDAFRQIRNIVASAGCVSRRTLMEIYEKHGKKQMKWNYYYCLKRDAFKNQHMLKEMAVLGDGKMPIKLSEFLMRKADKLDGQKRAMFIDGVAELSDTMKQGAMVLLAMGIKEDEISIADGRLWDAVRFYKMAKKYNLSQQEMKRWGLLFADAMKIQTLDGHIVKYRGLAPIEEMCYWHVRWGDKMTHCMYITYQREMDRICDLIGDGLEITVAKYGRGEYLNRCRRVLKALYKLEKIIKKNPDDLKGVRAMLEQEPMALGDGCSISIERSK